MDENNQNQIVPSNSPTNFFDKILYFVEFVVLIIVCFFAYSFALFYVGGKMEGLGILVFLFWMVSVLISNFVAAQIVYMDVKKLQAKGIQTENSPFGWAAIVFGMPLFGLSWYLATRRADFTREAKN